MKHIITRFLLLVVCIVASSTLSLATEIIPTELQGEHVKSMFVQADVKKDGSVEITETIDYEFDTRQARGIFRTIPYTKENTKGAEYSMDIDILSVTDEFNKPYVYIEQKTNGKLQLKIGDTSHFVTGEKRYVIRYVITGSLTYFSDHDEFYWNVTGNDWNVPIANINYQVTLPAEVDASTVQYVCYVGEKGEADNACKIQGNDVMVSNLAAKQGFTVAVGFPKNVVAVVEPRKVTAFFDTTLGTIVAIVLALFAFIWYIVYPLWLPVKWFLYGRDSKATIGEVSAHFDPPMDHTGNPLNPTETGAVLDEVVDLKDISAMIVHLAQRGYLRIEERTRKDFYFIQLKDHKEDRNLQDVERKLLSTLFKSGAELRLKHAKIGKDIQTIREKVYKNLVTYKFFPENPEEVRTFYTIMSGLAWASLNFPLIITSMVFGRIMPRKTLEGINAANQARSLRNFLKTQERQLEFQVQNQMMFEKLLPYAVAFGVEKQWAERFKDIALTQPEWYVGYGNQSAMNTSSFITSLDSSFKTFSVNVTPTISTSGFSSGLSGGFSGGGGGGGGGGSW